MKNNKGLTIVELLAVITFLAIVGIIAFVAIDVINRANREDALEAHVTNMLSSSLSYVSISDIPLPDIYITTTQLGLVDGNLTNAWGSGAACVYRVSLGLAGERISVGNASNICELRITLEYLVDRGVLGVNDEGIMVNPITDKNVDLKQSYISVIMVSQASSNVTTTTLSSTIGKYDGKWYYQLREVIIP